MGKKKKCLFLPFHCQDTFLPGDHRIQGKLKYLLIKRLRISLLKTTMKAMRGRIYCLICQIRKLSPRKVKRFVHGILAKESGLGFGATKKILSREKNLHILE